MVPTELVASAIVGIAVISLTLNALFVQGKIVSEKLLDDISTRIVSKTMTMIHQEFAEGIDRIAALSKEKK